MEFLSIAFSITLFISFVLYYIKANKAWQRVVLLGTSAVFISYYHWQYLIFALGITFFTFYMGKLLHKKSGTKAALAWLCFGIFTLVGTWLLARYCSDIFPLGISFYTFQAISYLVEIYWEEEPEDDLWDFSVYMLLFMKFLSGPIERSYDFLPQLKKAQTFDYDKVVNGLIMLTWGAFMKLVIADRISPSLDSVFNDVHAATNLQLLVATLLYPIQLYADFAGYTLMAIGIARMFGFNLSPNFDRPFASLSTAELWRRWHQSLSFWVRDYVFTTLSASLRKYKALGVYASLLVTFIVIGVWHGAGWSFALYGLFQGVVVIWERLTDKPRTFLKEKIAKSIFQPIMMVRTYVLFALSLLLFRLTNIADVWHVYKCLPHGFNNHVKELKLGMSDTYWIIFGVAVVLMFVIDYLHAKYNLIDKLKNQTTGVRWTVYFVLILLIFMFGSFGVENFIYVQF